MSNFYLMPTVSFKDASGNQFTAPKYFQTDLAGLSFAAVPYGAEPVAIVSLSAPNPALAAEPDVFSFPSDPSKTLSNADVASLDLFFAAANIPFLWLTVGMSWSDVRRQTATIFLLAQFVAGATGKPIFNGATLSTQYGQLPPTSGLSATALSVGVSRVNPVFDFSAARPANTVSDVLLAVSQQFTSPILIGGGSI